MKHLQVVYLFDLLSEQFYNLLLHKSSAPLISIDICEDPEIRERIVQLKTEQESKRLAEAHRRRVRRSQSNNTRL